jgi:uncharacterized damage-inducible protein DinB
MNAFFETLFEYNLHCNQQCSEHIIPFDSEIPQKTLKVFNHMLNAHQIWNSRVKGIPQAYHVWQWHDKKDWKHIDKTNFTATMHILDQYDLNESVSYTNSKGQFYTNNIKYILFHIINHSTYHRGQIASDLKAAGITPIPTDFIIYKR